MTPFEHVEPASIPEATGLLATHGDDARLLAGGQSLLILLRQRLVAPAVLVDLKGIPELRTIEQTDQGIRVGATVSYSTIAGRRDLPPLLAVAAGSVGSVHIRARGTIGGATAHADPASDALVALMALDGFVETDGPSGPRSIPAHEFPVGLFATRLEPASLVTAVVVPEQPSGATWGYERFHLREGEYPLTQAAVRLVWDDGACVDARIAVGGGFDRPARLPGIEASLVGTRRGELAADELARRVREAVRPFADVRGSAEWKARVVGAIAGRAYRRALEHRRAGDA